jgi:hypothetical protein
MLMLVSISVVPLPLQAQDSPLSIKPVVASPVSYLQTAWFLETVVPGEIVEREVEVSNSSDRVVEAELFSNDALQTVDGSFAYKDNTVENTQVGTWINVLQRTVSVPAKGSVRVHFLISAPKNTPPGEYAGVISVVEKKPTDQGKINVQFRQGVRLYLTVQGEYTTSVEVAEVETITDASTSWKDIAANPLDFDPQQVHIRYRLHNTSTVATIVEHTLTVTTPTQQITDTFSKDYLPGFDVENQFGIFVQREGKAEPLIWETGTYAIKLKILVRPLVTETKQPANLKAGPEGGEKAAQSDMTPEKLAVMKQAFAARSSSAASTPTDPDDLIFQVNYPPASSSSVVSTPGREENPWLYPLLIGAGVAFLTMVAGAGIWYYLKKRNILK